MTPAEIKALAEALAPLVAAEVVKQLAPLLPGQLEGEGVSLIRQLEIKQLAKQAAKGKR